MKLVPYSKTDRISCPLAVDFSSRRLKRVVVNIQFPD